MLALRPIGAVAWESPFQLIMTGYGLRLSRDTRERYRSPTSLKFIRAGGLLDMIAHLLLRLSSILHVFLSREFLPIVSMSSRMMRAARVLSVETDTLILR